MLTNASFQSCNVVAQSLPTIVLNTLINIRQEWELAAGGTSLVDCECQVGLFLFDIVVRLDIPVEEQRHLLGPTLFDEVTKFVISKVNLKIGVCRRTLSILIFSYEIPYGVAL